MIHTTVQVIRYILKDLLEPAAYLPFGIAAGGLFLLSWYLWRRYVCGEKPVRRPDRSQWLLILCVVYAAGVFLPGARFQDGNRSDSLFHLDGRTSGSCVFH